MRLVVCLTASIGMIISGSALFAIWWTKHSTARRWRRSRHILIVNEDEFNEKKQILYRSGKAALQVIMDFDYTMTQYYTPSGHTSTSTHGVFSRSGLLPQSFAQREAYLFEKYFKYEIDPTLSPSDRYKYMEEWWHQAHANLIEHKMSKTLLQQCLEPNRATILLRQGCREVIDLLQENDIPLLIFSAGIGDVIEEYFRREDVQPANMHILSNRMVMDEHGLVVGFQEPVVHPSNKALLVDRAAHVLHPDRAAFIVVGDHIHDALMCDSIPYAEVHLKVGLLNTDIEARIDHFKEVYDVIIIDDGPLDFLLDLVKEIIMN